MRRVRWSRAVPSPHTPTPRSRQVKTCGDTSAIVSYVVEEDPQWVLGTFCNHRPMGISTCDRKSITARLSSLVKGITSDETEADAMIEDFYTRPENEVRASINTPPPSHTRPTTTTHPTGLPPAQFLQE